MELTTSDGSDAQQLRAPLPAAQHVLDSVLHDIFADGTLPRWLHASLPAERVPKYAELHGFTHGGSSVAAVLDPETSAERAGSAQLEERGASDGQSAHAAEDMAEAPATEGDVKADFTKRASDDCASTGRLSTASAGEHAARDAADDAAKAAVADQQEVARTGSAVARAQAAASPIDQQLGAAAPELSADEQLWLKRAMRPAASGGLSASSCSRS